MARLPLVKAPPEPAVGELSENSIAIALGLVGDEWNLAIARLAIMSGVRRYNGFRDQLGIANSVLSTRLRHLVQTGLFSRSCYSEAPSRYEYVLTDCGRDLWRVLLAIWAWEATWVAEHTEPLPAMYHTVCEEEFSPVMTCRACGLTADTRDVRGEFGPSGGFLRSMPRGATRRRSTDAPAKTLAVPASPSSVPGLVPQTIELIGNRWSIATLSAAFLGARRFTDIEAITGAPPAVVSGRLRIFCQMGVLRAVPTGQPGSSRVEYRLTDKGRAFFPHAMVMHHWGDTWFRAPEGPAMLLTHTRCGQLFTPILTCSACRAELHGSKIQVGGDPPKARLCATPGEDAQASSGARRS